MASREVVDAFWSWFKSASPRFAENPIPTRLIDEMNSRIDCLGPYDWEIGPSPSGEELTLVISPGLNPELLPSTKEIVSQAPKVPGWQFYPARPPKAWGMKWSMQLAHGKLDFDANDWKYVLFQYDDGLVGVDLIGSNLDSSLSSSDRESVAHFFLLSTLGEEAFLTKVCEWSLSDSKASDLMNKASDVRHLASHLNQIVPSLN